MCPRNFRDWCKRNCSWMFLEPWTDIYSAQVGGKKKRSPFITTFYATLEWEPVCHSAALFMTFLYMKYSLRKFPIWNIHSECCWGCFPAHKLLTAFQSYQVFRACSSLDVKAMINEHWVLRKWMSFITHSITFDFCFSGISTILLSTYQSMLE